MTKITFQKLKIMGAASSSPEVPASVATPTPAEVDRAAQGLESGVDKPKDEVLNSMQVLERMAAAAQTLKGDVSIISPCDSTF